MMSSRGAYDDQMRNGSVPISIRVSVELNEDLRKLAKERNECLSYFIKNILKKGISEMKNENIEKESD